MSISGFVATAFVCVLGMFSIVHAQEIEPRAYSNAPVGMNFLITGYAYTQGAVPFDSALPIENAELKTQTAIVAYANVFELFGQSAKFDAITPYTSLSGTAELAGQPIERNINNIGDPRFRLSVNLYGAPALSLKDFRNYEQDLIVGVSLQVSPPWGQYDSNKIVNLGLNRWAFKPELGISKALGQLTLEAQAAAAFFTDNKDFFGGNTRSQKPIYSLQGHAIYGFDSGIWASLDATYFAGGRTSINGTENSDLQQNWRLGATLAFPVDARNSIKFYGSSGLSARTGNSYDLLGIAWQYRWGAGL